MHTFGYKGYAVTLTGTSFVGGLEDWSFSIAPPNGEVIRSPADQTFSSDIAAASAARKWIDEHRA